VQADGRHPPQRQRPVQGHAGEQSAREQTEQHLVDVFGDVLAVVRESMEATGGGTGRGRAEPVDAIWRHTGQPILSTLPPVGTWPR
jgi:hypothetical protein